MVDGNPALNRVKWTPSGMNVTIGDDNGKIWLYELGEVWLFKIVLFVAFYSKDLYFLAAIGRAEGR